jgi:hypothetical protein
MSRRPAIRETDVANAVKGAILGGVDLACVRIGPDGTINLILGAPPIVAIAPEYDLDRELAAFEARHGQG